MTPSEEAAALLARYDSAIAYGNGPLVVDLAVRNMPDLLRALLDEQTRQTQILTRLNRRCQVAEAAAHPNATSGKGQKVSAYLWEMNTRLFGLCESHSPERLEQPGGYTRPSCVMCDADSAEQEITRLKAVSELWPFIQALERACWKRRWSEVKAARKALEDQIGGRPNDPLFPPDTTDEA